MCMFIWMFPSAIIKPEDIQKAAAAQKACYAIALAGFTDRDLENRCFTGCASKIVFTEKLYFFPLHNHTLVVQTTSQIL